MGMTMNRAQIVGLVAAKAVMGASLVLGFGTLPIAHADSDPGIVTDSKGQLRDCTVTDQYGVRSDDNPACDEYWHGAPDRYSEQTRLTDGSIVRLYYCSPDGGGAADNDRFQLTPCR